MYRYILIITSLLALIPLAGAVENKSPEYSDQIFDPRIKTVQLYRPGWNLSYPVIRLNSGDKLELHFDLLDDNIETFVFNFIHCDKDWKRSDIFVNDYLTDFYDNRIEDYRHSFNTTTKYIHYSLSFPNEKFNFRISGNYILQVSKADEPDKPVLSRRFIITEDVVKINISARRPGMAPEANTSQQIDFTVNYRGIAITDPHNTVFAFVLQNGRWNNAKRNLKPDFLGDNELRYTTLSEKNIFRGGNEFRYFDIRSIRYLSEFIQRIDYIAPGYNVLLYPSENREFKPYFYRQDFNGKYYIAVQEGRNQDIEADYLRVYFTLPSQYRITGGEMYVSGALNDWNFDTNNKMFYNIDNEAYECSMLLKQGWYDFEYVYLRDGDTQGVATLFEGSHYETENDYSTIIYYRNPRERYDRVLGAQTFNTLNRISF